MAELITELTSEQEALLPLFLEAWMGVNSDTEPADRPRAEAAICGLYREAGCAPPRFVWKDSPLGAYNAMNDGIPGEDLDHTLHLELKAHPKARIFKSLALSNRQSPAKGFLESLEDQAKKLMCDRKNRVLPLEIEMLLCGELRGKYWRPFFFQPWSQQESSWVAVYRFFQTLGFVFEGKSLQWLHLWEEVLRSCFWWWPFQGSCFISDRPMRLLLDSTYGFHCPDGPVVGFRDGWEVYVWRGLCLPREIVMEPATLKTIGSCTTLEYQRVLIERYGLERYVADIGAREVARDNLGVLLEFKVAYGFMQQVVRMENPSPEQDGESRIYFLPVRERYDSPTAALESTSGKRPVT